MSEKTLGKALELQDRKKWTYVRVLFKSLMPRFLGGKLSDSVLRTGAQASYLKLESTREQSLKMTALVEVSVTDGPKPEIWTVFRFVGILSRFLSFSDMKVNWDLG